MSPSPKRKRDASDPASTATVMPPFAPRLNTSSPAPAPASGESSPRSIVADQLRHLEIKGPMPILDFGAGGATPEVRKRAKRSDSIHNRPGAALEGFHDIPIRASQSAAAQDGKTAMGGVHSYSNVPEIPETPQGSFSSTTTTLAAAAGGPSSSPIRSSHSSPSSHTMPKPRPHACSRRKSPSPPLTALTWQDSEITGHLVDPSQDPDDDGTGINGIGFKPTPALAYARAQRRRQQVMEWRAREAKDARQKRSERRRRGIAGFNGTGSGVENGKDRIKRVVRFA
ncbi:hypothetical protein AOQ84DRAFT_230571 [Glonium stellatum]|uniref:Uncharacterized protein n=1 Tax=Glonium stellatum TaxID=574774 RepID=A0A8E2ENW0_9PEZI|nr:hypothetical protein AOQ84DRAFT_230571 [Glonium stellatum]